MVINISSVSKFSFFEKRSFVSDYILNIVSTHPEHSFFFISDGTENIILTAPNCSIIYDSHKQVNILFWKIWYRYKLPTLLKKYKANVFINLDSICSLKTTIPQCLLLPDISFVQHLSLFKKSVTASLSKAAMIITFSQSAKNDICAQYYKTPPEKIKVMYTGLDTRFLAVEWEEKERTREKYTEAKEYFLYPGEITIENNLINLLKAFSFFKKRQKSNMQLIIATKNIATNNAFIESLKTYKYRNEVKIITQLSDQELIAITAAAYALVVTTQQNGSYASIVQAMHCGVPVIVNNSVLMTEICGEAALFTDALIFENIADKMMLVFKDENKRNQLITSGKKQAALFTLTETRQLFWQNIVKCANATA